MPDETRPPNPYRAAGATTLRPPNPYKRAEKPDLSPATDEDRAGIMGRLGWVPKEEDLRSHVETIPTEFPEGLNIREYLSDEARAKRAGTALAQDAWKEMFGSGPVSKAQIKRAGGALDIRDAQRLLSTGIGAGGSVGQRAWEAAKQIPGGKHFATGNASELTDPKVAKQYLDAFEKVEASAADDDRLRLWAANTAGDVLSSLFVPVDEMFPLPEVEKRDRERERGTRGLLGKAGAAAAVLAPQLTIIGAGQFGIGRGLMRTGMSPKLAARMASAGSMGFYSGAQGGDVEKGILFGFLLPGMGDALAKAMPALGKRGSAAAGEAAAFLSLSTAIHGVPETMGDALIELSIGAGFGFVKGKPTLVDKLEPIHKKWMKSKDPAERAELSREFAETLSTEIEAMTGQKVKAEAFESMRDAREATRTEPVEPVTAEEVARLEPEAATPGSPAEPAHASARERTPVRAGAVPAKTTAALKPAIAPTPETDPLVGVKLAENRQAQLRALDPEITRDYRAQPKVVGEALDKFSDTEAGSKMVRELRDSPRPPSDTDIAVLLIEKSNLAKSERLTTDNLFEAQRRGKPEEIAKYRQELLDIETKQNALSESAELSLARWGRTGAMAQRLMKSDLTLAEVKRKAAAVQDGQELRPEQTAAVEKVWKVLDLALRANDKMMAGRLAKEVDALISTIPKRRAPKEPTEFGTTNRLVSREAGEAANQRMRVTLGNSASMSKFLDPAFVKDFAIWGAYRIEGGVRTLAAFTKDLVKELGEEVRGDAKALYAESRKHLADQVRQNPRARRRKSGEPLANEIKRKRRELTDEQRVDLAIKSNARAIKEYERQIVENDLFPDAKTKATPDSMRLKALQEHRTKLKELRNELQKVERPPPTAAERAEVAAEKSIAELDRRIREGELFLEAKPKPSSSRLKELHARRDSLRAELRALQKEARPPKKSGRKPPTGEQRTKAAVEAVKRSIAEVERRISEGDLFPGKKASKTPVTAELKTLRTKRDAAKAELKRLQKIERPPEKREKAERTDQQRIDAEIRSNERAIKEYRRQIAENDLFPSGEKKPKPSSQRLRDLQAERKDLVQQRKELRKADPRSETRRVDRVHKARLKRWEKKLDELAKTQDQLERGVFAPAEKVDNSVPFTPEEIGVIAKMDAAKHKVGELMFKYRQQARAPVIKLFDTMFVQIPNTSRALRASFDLSAPRQMWPMLLSDPASVIKATRNMAIALRSREGLERVQAERRADPMFQDAKVAEVFFSELGQGAHKLDEAFMSDLADNILIVAGTGRAHIEWLNQARFNRFKKLVATLEKGGGMKTPGNLKVLGNLVNVTTGRGSLGDIKSSLSLVNGLFFSTRYLAARVQLLLGQPIWTPRGGYKGTGQARKLAAMEYARMMMGIAVVTGMAKGAAELMGAEADFILDPRDTDYGKFVFDNTRYDFTGGVGSVATLGARLAEAGGHTLGLVDEPKFRDTDRLIGRFTRNKFAPAFAVAFDFFRGEHFGREEMTAGTTLRNLFVPLTVESAFFDRGDVNEILKEHGVPAATAALLSEIFGISVMNYDRKSRRSSGRSGAR